MNQPLLYLEGLQRCSRFFVFQLHHHFPFPCLLSRCSLKLSHVFALLCASSICPPSIFHHPHHPEAGSDEDGIKLITAFRKTTGKNSALWTPGGRSCRSSLWQDDIIGCLPISHRSQWGHCCLLRSGTAAKKRREMTRAWLKE